MKKRDALILASSYIAQFPGAIMRMHINNDQVSLRTHGSSLTGMPSHGRKRHSYKSPMETFKSEHFNHKYLNEKGECIISSQPTFQGPLSKCTSNDQVSLRTVRYRDALPRPNTIIVVEAARWLNKTKKPRTLSMEGIYNQNLTYITILVVRLKDETSLRRASSLSWSLEIL